MESANSRQDSSAWKLVRCPNRDPGTKRERLGAKGGKLERSGHSLEVTDGAVDQETEFRLDARNSGLREIEVRAVNGPDPFVFNKQVKLTLSYAGCSISAKDEAQLRILRRNPHAKDGLDDLGGTVDTKLKTVTIWTNHLSGYVIGHGRA